MTLLQFLQSIEGLDDNAAHLALGRVRIEYPWSGFRVKEEPGETAPRRYHLCAGAGPVQDFHFDEMHNPGDDIYNRPRVPIPLTVIPAERRRLEELRELDDELRRLEDDL